MALTIPNYAVAADDSATQLYTHLSGFLTNNCKINQYLSSNDLPFGTLFRIQKKTRCLFVFICDEKNLASNNIPLDRQNILHGKAKPLQKLIHFQKSLLPQQLHAHCKLLTPFLIIFPNSLNPNTQFQLESRGIHFYGQEALESNQFLPLVERHLGIPMSSYALDYMRCRFNPESTVSKKQSLYVNEPSSSPQIESFLLNSEQEYALKQDLMPNKGNHPYNLRLIHGPAGSGKSLVLLLRAKLLGKLYPEKKILVLTHNKAINHSLKSRYKNLFGDKNNNRECHPFMEWCLRQWKGTRRFVFEDEVMDVVTQMLMRHLQDNVFSKHLLLREINFVKDRLIFSEADYLKADRSGQSYSLDTDMRQRVWRAILDFDTELESRHILLWADLPRLLWKDFEENNINLETYDHILVDEAQYFAPIWFELIKKSLKPSLGQLFMVADPDQGFLNRQLSWKETGLDLRDRTFRLHRSYRSNPLILKVADEFRFNRIPDETTTMLPTKPQGKQSNSRNKAPVLLHFHNDKDEQNRLFSEINQLLKNGTAAKDILVLDARNFSARPLLQAMKKTLGQSVCMLTDPYWDEEALRVCELQAATGIESPIVFIIGLQALFDAENKLGIGDRERHTLMIENTRKLYMGMTRASEKLVLLLNSKHIPKSLKIKEINFPTSNSIKKTAEVRYLHA